MGHFKLRKICILSVVIFMGAQLSFSQVIVSGPHKRFLTERGLAGLRVKLADNFTIGAWGALYYGTQYFPNFSKFDPFEYQGFDAVPGFDCALGTICGKIKVNAGGDLYGQVRYVREGNTAQITAPNKYEFRPRANLGFTVPFAGSSSLQWVNRMERQIQNQNTGPTASYIRIRSTLKLTGPKLTSYKISPFALYESFNSPGNINYYLEAEYGVNFTPIKNTSVSFSHMICTVPERNNYETHQLCFYIFYTIDAANQFSNFLRSIKSVDR